MNGNFGGIVQFGAYRFPVSLTEYSTNFGDGVPKTSRLVGIDGGFSDDGDAAAQTAIGNVRMGFMLIAESRSEMDRFRDDVRAMMNWGLQKLVYKPTDPYLAQRFCWARVNNISMPENKSQHSDLWQRVTINFQVPTPHWYVPTYMPALLDGQWTLGDSLQVGQGAFEFSAAGTSTEIEITQRGNVDALTKISLLPPVGESCENAIIQRVAWGAVVDEVRYAGVVAAESELIIDGMNQRVMLDGANAIHHLSYLRPSFLSLAPGLNRLRVLFKNSGDEAAVRLWFHDVYR